jgi:hypothetical protein
MPEAVIALWEPDIFPPADWLVPAVLYQERISTIAPLGDLSDRDSMQARELRAELGDLYQPLSMLDFFPHGGDIPRLLESRLPLWVSWMESLADRTGDVFTRRWVRRCSGWPARRQFLEAAVPAADAARQAASERVRALAGRCEYLGKQAALARAEVARLADELRPGLVRDKELRRAAYAGALARRSAIISRGGRWGQDRDADAAIRAIDQELKDIQRSLSGAPLSAARQRYDEARRILGQRQETEQAAAAELRSARHQLTEAASRLERARDYRDRPWGTDVLIDPWLRPESLHETLPPHLDTIGPGKVYNEVFEFLATEGGMWVSRSDRVPYAGTLVGPRRVVEDVIAVLAEYYCASHRGWVLMSAASQPQAVRPEVSGAPELVTLAARWVLPAPANATLAQALDFRRTHEGELAGVRQALSASIPDLSSLDDLQDAISAMAVGAAGPLKAIERALEAQRSVSLQATGVTVFRKAVSGARNLAAGLAAGVVASPVLGNTIGLSGIEATVGGGTALTMAGLAARQTRSRNSLGRLTREIGSGPYRYVYEVGKRFGTS